MQPEVFVPTNNARPTTAGISARKITKKNTSMRDSKLYIPLFKKITSV
jgi:hypothetical protein